jgi:hypothetical protein
LPHRTSRLPTSRDSDALAGIDPGDAHNFLTLLANGTLSRDELGKIYALSPAELDVLAERPPSRAGIDAELADIAQRRRTDRGAYFNAVSPSARRCRRSGSAQDLMPFKDEALQARELEVLALRDKAVRKRARATAAFVPTTRTAVRSTRNSPRSTSIGARNRVANMRDVVAGRLGRFSRASSS